MPLCSVMMGFSRTSPPSRAAARASLTVYHPGGPGAPYSARASCVHCWRRARARRVAHPRAPPGLRGGPVASQQSTPAAAGPDRARMRARTQVVACPFARHARA